MSHIECRSAIILRAGLHGEFQPGLQFGTVAGLRIRCDYMMNFSLGAIELAPVR